MAQARTRVRANETRQVNVALPADKMRMVDRIIDRDGLTLIEYFDKLVTADLRRERTELLKYFRQQEQRAREETQQAERSLRQLFPDETVPSSAELGGTQGNKEGVA